MEKIKEMWQKVLDDIVKNKDKIKVKLTGIPENVKVEGDVKEVEITFEIK